MNEHDEKLINAAMQDAEAAYAKRREEFSLLLGITAEQYHKIVAFLFCDGGLISERPFMRAPLAQDAFVAGYICCHRKHYS